MKTPAIFFIFLFVTATSCKKERLLTNARPSISAGDIRFDTLFTTTGSVTKVLKIFNDNNGKLLINKISLRKGTASYFNFNADGRPGPETGNLEIAANDSIYVFVSVKIDPSDSTLPFIISDTLDIDCSENRSSVSLTAWGQNAYFLKSRAITSDTTWTNERPIVITGGALVIEGVTLTINAGTKIYLHADAPLLVDGSLVANGEKYDSTKIVFQGDRLDRYYNDLPASWPGIYFTNKSRSNQLRNVIVKNAYQGIVSESVADPSDFKIRIDESVIDNCYDGGIIGVNTSIRARNCLVSNCGKNVLLAAGGRYDFANCTIVSVANIYIPHKEPVLTLSDFVRRNDVLSFGEMDASFVNCIFWGTDGPVDDEVLVVREGSENFAGVFSNCFWKMKTVPANITPADMIENADPGFVDSNQDDRYYDFRPAEGSPLIDKGASTDVNIDLDGNSRVNIPDIGAYESTF